ncbi:MAG: antitoxin, partial [Giesbergeria sp.]|nr:antitoxin [Giesbergeria sp.]MBP7083182.1 antitoxin [Giesbergeria sp.]
GGADAVARAFRQALDGKHSDVVKNALDLLRVRFAQVGETEGYRKDGPVAVAKFELGEGDEPEQREARALRQREASDIIAQILSRID